MHEAITQGVLCLPMPGGGCPEQPLSCFSGIFSTTTCLVQKKNVVLCSGMILFRGVVEPREGLAIILLCAQP